MSDKANAGMLEKKFILRIGKTVLIREMEVERSHWLGHWQGPDPRCRGVTLCFKDSEVFDTRESAEDAARGRLTERHAKLRKQIADCEKLLDQIIPAASDANGINLDRIETGDSDG